LAIALYKGNFLAEFQQNEPAFLWIQRERDNLAAHFERISEMYIGQLCTENKHTNAAALCLELIERDECMEAIWIKLLACYEAMNEWFNVEDAHQQYLRMKDRNFPEAEVPAEIVRLMERRPKRG
jgi:two-component SAPR family response regulator